MAGINGRKLSDSSSAGMRSLHGIHVSGFPNCFFVQPGRGASYLVNVPHNLGDTAKTIATIVSHMRASGFDTVELGSELS